MLFIPRITPTNQKPHQYLGQKPSWKKASTEEKETFKGSLADKLQHITAPGSMQCRNPTSGVQNFFSVRHRGS